MRKGLVWAKKVVILLICMAMVTDSQAVGVIAVETADTLLADDKELEVEREAEDNLIEEDTIIEADQQSINEFADVLLENDDVYFDSLSDNSAEDTKAEIIEGNIEENIEGIKGAIEDDDTILDNELLILNDSISGSKENHISLGDEHSAAIDENGQLWTWGWNGYGQLGYENVTTSSTPKKVKELENVKIKEVSLGSYHSAAIDESGQLWTWGRNDYGQLGDGTTKDRSTPKKVKELENVKIKKVSLGGYHSAAIDVDGQLWTWGRNIYGQLGSYYGDSSTPKKVLEKVKVKEVSLGIYHSAAIDVDGQLWTWGRGSSGQLGDGTKNDSTYPKKVKGLEKVKVKEVSLGIYHSAAIDENGQLWTWGQNNCGQLGDGTTEGSSTPKKVLEKVKVKEVSLGSWHSAAIDVDGQLWTWGYNYYGRLGDGTTTDSSTPKKVKGLENVNVVEVSLGGDHSAAIDTSGQLWTWGENSSGQLGDGTKKDRHLPAKSPYFTDIEYTVIFDSCGGTKIESKKVKKNEKVIKPSDPTKDDDSSFIGWYKDKVYNELYDFDTPVTSNITLYAKWKKPSTEIGTKSIVIQYSDNNSTTVKWESSLFQGNSLQRNNDMLRLCAALSAAAEDGGKDKGAYGEYITKAYQDKNGLDVDGFALYSYEKSEYNQKDVRRESGSDPFSNDNNLAFSIAHKGVKVNGEDVNIVFVVGRGTQEDIEGILDGMAGTHSRPEYGNNTIYDYPWDFATDMWAGLYDYAGKHEEITSGRLIFVVTGHSLGGAAANLLAARLTDFNSNLPSENDIGWATKNDIYCYTFGAIPSLEWNICDGYENIHNVFNIKDTFGPFGPGVAPLGIGITYCWPNGVSTDDASSIFKKYGHLELFCYDFYEGADRPNPKDTRNHNMEAYIDALDHCDDTTCSIHGCKGFEWRCNGEHTAMSDYYSNMLEIHCPVDVAIYKDNVLMGRVINNQIEQSTVKIPIFVQEDEKYVILPNRDQYRVIITATDSGKMDYKISDLSGEGSCIKDFSDISLSKGKTFTSEIDNNASLSDVTLYVTDDEGEPIKQVLENGTEINYSKYRDVLPEDVPADGVIPDGIWIAGVTSKEYTGKSITQDFRVYDHMTLLKEKADYTTSYKNNTNAYTIAEGEGGFSEKKSPSLTVTGKGNYDSKETVFFRILPVDISGGDFSADDMTLAYTGKKQKVNTALYWNGKAIKNKTEYKFDVYKADDKSFATPLGDSITAAGDYVVKMIGNDNFTGTRTVALKVSSDHTLVSKLKTGKVPNVTYTGKPFTPEPEVYDGKLLLTKDMHYRLSYASNVEPGTGYAVITGIPESGYAGTKRIAFKIAAPKAIKAAPYDISKDTDKRITINCKASMPFMKGGAKPVVTVTFNDDKGNTKTLVEGIDYKLAYKNNNIYNNAKKKPSVTVTGMGSYKGSRSTDFSLTEKNIRLVTFNAEDKVFKNKANLYTTRVEMIDEDGVKLQVGKDYNKVFEYSYANKTEVIVDGNPVTRAAGDTIDKKDIIPANTVISVKATAIPGSGYTGTVIGTYRMTPSSISSAKITIPTQTYTGKAITLDPKDIKVMVGKEELKPYDPATQPNGFVIVGYTNNVNKGTAKVTIRGMGNYGGFKTQSFKIKAKGFHWWWRKQSSLCY